MNFDADIQKCLEVLKNGGVILYPTDTIWGVGCDATNEKSVERIFQIKNRNEAKSLIVLVNDIGMLNRYVKEIPAQAWELIELSDSPITIIYDEPRGVAKNVLAQDGSIAVRLTKDDFCKKLIYKFGKPIVSTSANISGDMAPQNFSEVKDEIFNAVDYVVNWRQEEWQKGKSSSIIKLKTNGEIKIIRK